MTKFQKLESIFVYTWRIWSKWSIFMALRLSLLHPISKLSCNAVDNYSAKANVTLKIFKKQPSWNLNILLYVCWKDLVNLRCKIL